jgi:hypothetical protein
VIVSFDYTGADRTTNFLVTCQTPSVYQDATYFKPVTLLEILKIVPDSSFLNMETLPVCIFM